MDGQTGNVVELPPYRALLVVDVKEFSGERGRDHARITAEIPEILHQAFRRCGYEWLLDEVQFQGSTGDGYFLGFESRMLPFLITPFLPALQEELKYQNSVSRQSIRMRVSINVGPMTDSGANKISDGSGDARIETHRLLDSSPVRELLTRSGMTTCVAAIVSERAFQDAVRPGFTDDEPEMFVPAPVAVKTYQGRAYLRVPCPSGDLLAVGFPAEQEHEEPVDEPEANTEPAASADKQVNYQVGDLSGSGHHVNIVGGNQHTNAQHSSGDGAIHIGGDSHGGISLQFGGRRRA